MPRTFTVNKVAQTITFATISTKTLAQSPLALSATSSSGLTVSFSSTTPAVCTVSGTTATLLTTGTCGIAANQAGDSYWAAATQVLRTFSVTKASQTITFATLSNRTYSPTPFTVTGTASSGLPVAFAGTTPTICAVATDGGGITSVTMLAAGTCTVTANQAGDVTYNAATQVSRSFTISKAGQTLTMDTIANKNVGDADFQPDVTNSAGLPYTLSTTTTAVCTVAYNAVTIVATGTCTVKADAPATPAYNAATQQSKSFTVAAARTPIVYYVHPDQIGSPRVMTKASDNSVVWRWDNEEAFGDNLPNEKPSGTGERFKYDLRFAGQVWDKETSTSYNYFRDYSPTVGSYVQSDPIGLEGGINTYGYVGGRPIAYTDPLGLFNIRDYIPEGAPIIAMGDAYGGLAAYMVGLATNDDRLQEAAMEGLQCTRFASMQTLGLMLSMGRAAGRETSLYQKVGPQGDHLKFGIATNPATRYTREELGGGRLRILATGPRSEMLKLERSLHERLPIGPQEGQKFYIQKQVDQGLLPPPYKP